MEIESDVIFPLRTDGYYASFKHDTVSCVSLTGKEYKGILIDIGNSSYIEIKNNNTIYQFRYYQINPLKMVMVEKFIYRDEHNWYFENNTGKEEYEFLLKRKI